MTIIDSISEMQSDYTAKKGVGPTELYITQKDYLQLHSEVTKLGVKTSLDNLPPTFSGMRIVVIPYGNTSVG